MKKTLVLIRHAHRDNTVRSKDNGLSEKGREQARWLKKFYFKRFGDNQTGGVWLASSPKKRCIETVSAIAAEMGKTVDLNPDLDEQSNQESIEKFEGRVAHFLKDWKDSPQEL